MASRSASSGVSPWPATMRICGLSETKTPHRSPSSKRRSTGPSRYSSCTFRASAFRRTMSVIVSSFVWNGPPLAASFYMSFVERQLAPRSQLLRCQRHEVARLLSAGQRGPRSTVDALWSTIALAVEDQFDRLDHPHFAAGGATLDCLDPGPENDYVARVIGDGRLRNLLRRQLGVDAVAPVCKALHLVLRLCVQAVCNGLDLPRRPEQT